MAGNIEARNVLAYEVLCTCFEKFLAINLSGLEGRMIDEVREVDIIL